MPPENGGYECEQGDYVEWAQGGAGGFAVEKEVEKFEAYGVALEI